ncbi:MAG: DUF3224 domain-containing protein [Gammaproteobacteria bacterium]
MGKIMTTHASGTFEVKIIPLEPYSKDGESTLGRMSLDKEFKGDLAATSRGEMLSGGKPDKGSAGYVAMEHVRGTLHGRKGTFLLQHSGTLNRGVPSLSVTVVPDSGTGELTGLAGMLTINIVDGNHFYEFDYILDGGR